MTTPLGIVPENSPVAGRSDWEILEQTAQALHEGHDSFSPTYCQRPECRDFATYRGHRS